MMVELTIGEYLEAARWYAQCPAKVRRLIDRFPPGSKWRIRSQAIIYMVESGVIRRDDWFVPVDFASNGMVNMQQIDGDTGTPLTTIHRLRPADLIPAEH